MKESGDTITTITYISFFFFSRTLQILKIKYGYAQSFASTSTFASAKQEFLELDQQNKKSQFVDQATPRFELGIKDLQSPALPLGHAAKSDQKYA